MKEIKKLHRPQTGEVIPEGLDVLFLDKINEIVDTVNSLTKGVNWNKLDLNSIDKDLQLKFEHLKREIDNCKKKTNKGANTARHKPQCDCPKCFDKQTEAVRCAMGLDK